MKSYPLRDLPRQSNPNVAGRERFENSGYVVTPDPENRCYYSCPGQGYQARDFYHVILRFKELGVDPELLDELLEWCEQVWPKSDWQTLRLEIQQ
jgi:hypothetical protein